MIEYITKGEKRDIKRKNQFNKQIKHNFWDNWWKPQWASITRAQKKMLKKKTNFIK